VAAHGGTIAAESDGIAGHGTTFRIRLPRRD
jgi:signal transduction histidine kinase